MSPKSARNRLCSFINSGQHFPFIEMLKSLKVLSEKDIEQVFREWDHIAWQHYQNQIKDTRYEESKPVYNRVGRIKPTKARR